MKKLLAVLFVVGLAACGPEDATPETPIDDDFDPTNATLLRTGMLMGSGGYSVSGTANIYEANGKKVLVFESNFSSSNGPDLKVYLSTTTGASSFVNLGNLKSTTGQQSYEIPEGTDLTQFKFALVWCQRFSALFGKAETV